MTAPSRILRIFAVVLVAVTSVTLLDCQATKTQVFDRTADRETNTVVTVLLDFSASFAPFTANDAAALQAIKEVIGRKATHEWAGTTQVLVRKIGTSSVLNAPLCEPVTYAPHIVGSGNDQDSFQEGLAKCLGSPTKANLQTKGEDYTDISGAIELASQATQSLPGTKLILILSDFVEQQAPKAQAAKLKLNREHIIMLHRPGLDDKSIPSHLSRISEWHKTLVGAGAGAVAAIPEQWATRGVLEQVLDKTSKGTLGLVVLDGNGLSPLGAEESRRQRIVDLAMGIGQLAKDWQPPVTILWYAVPSRPASISWMPPIEYQPRLIEQKGDVNTADELMRDLRETAIGTLRLAKPSSSTALVDALLLLHAPDVTGTRHMNVFLVSSLGAAPQAIPPSLRFEEANISIIYSPARSDGADPNLLFARLSSWKQLFTKLGASRVCMLELSSLTAAALASCPGRGGAS
jgi:hypothetical protein